MDRYKNIISGKIDFSSEFSVEVQDMISRLCIQDQSERMGRTKGGTKSVMQHLWFESFEWKSLIDKSMEAPFLPTKRATLSVYDKVGGHLRQGLKVKRSSSIERESTFYASNLSNFSVETLMDSIVESDDDDDDDDDDETEKKESYDARAHRRESHIFGENRYASRIEDLKAFKKKHLKHMIVKNDSIVKKCKTSSFDHFYLLSASPKDVGPLSYEASTRNYLDPFISKSINVVDRYPQVSIMDDVLAPEVVASFCFPSGVKLRLIPKCALEKGAKITGLVGNQLDKYQLHTVRNTMQVIDKSVFCF